LESAAPKTIADVRARSAPLVRFSETIAQEHLALKLFLRDRVYRHYRVLRMTNKAENVVTSLFKVFMERPELLPREYFQAAHDGQAPDPDRARARTVADYIAGMTDRYAIVEYERLFDPAKRS
jgi:dGTPase